MENQPSTPQNNQPAEPPAPETLKPRADDGTPAEPPAGSAPASPEKDKPRRPRSYRPSHRATFIGIAAVAVILALNAGILAFVLKSQAKTAQQVNGSVSISPKVLNKLGVSNTSLGDSGVQLNIDPDTQFQGDVKVAGDTTISGQLKLNSKFTATDASLTQLEAGNTALSQLNVNGNSTFSNVNLRNGLIVAGSTQLQGTVTVNGLVTVSNNLTVTGNVAIGGTLTVGTFSARSLTSTSTLTIGGHIITNGVSPGVGPGGGALGSNGTVSINGNDATGQVSINIGTGSAAGTLANIAFKTEYGSSPRVVITPIGVAGTFYVTNLSASGFSIAVGNALPPGGYAVDYVVEQ